MMKTRLRKIPLRKHSLPMKLRKKLLPRKKLRRKRKSPKSPRKFSMKSLLPLICLRK